MSIKIFEARIEKIKRATISSKNFRDRGEGSLPKSLRILIDEDSGLSSVVAFNGHENILNARVNEIPTFVHSTDTCVVIAQLCDAAYYKDGIFRRFYIHFSDNEGAGKFSKLYNRESNIVKKLKKLKESMEISNKACKELPTCGDINEESKGFHSSPKNESEDDSGNESADVSDDSSRHSSDHANENNGCGSVGAKRFEDVEELLEEFGFDEGTQLWPHEPLKPFGNF